MDMFEADFDLCPLLGQDFNCEADVEEDSSQWNLSTALLVSILVLCILLIVALSQMMWKENQAIKEQKRRAIMNPISK